MALAASSMNLGVAAASTLMASVYPAGAGWVSAVALVLIAAAIVALRPGRADGSSLASVE